MRSTSGRKRPIKSPRRQRIVIREDRRQPYDALRRAARYGLQHILVKHPNWHDGLRRAFVKAGIHHDDEFEFRYDEHALPPKANCRRPLHLVSFNQGTAEPEKVAVEIWAQAIDLWCRRGVNPRGRDDLGPFPIAALQNELANLHEISRAQAQGTSGDDIAVRISWPFHIGDAKGLEQQLTREVVGLLAGRLFQDGGDQ